MDDHRVDRAEEALKLAGDRDADPPPNSLAALLALADEEPRFIPEWQRPKSMWSSRQKPLAKLVARVVHVCRSRPRVARRRACSPRRTRSPNRDGPDQPDLAAIKDER